MTSVPLIVGKMDVYTVIIKKLTKEYKDSPRTHKPGILHAIKMIIAMSKVETEGHFVKNTGYCDECGDMTNISDTGEYFMWCTACFAAQLTLCAECGVEYAHLNAITGFRSTVCSKCREDERYYRQQKRSGDPGYHNCIYAGCKKLIPIKYDYCFVHKNIIDKSAIGTE